MEKEEKTVGLKKQKFDWLMIIPYVLFAIIIVADLIVIFYVSK